MNTVVTVRDFEQYEKETGKKFVLVTDSQEIDEVIKYLGWSGGSNYGCLFVSIKDGDYDEVWGCVNPVPWLDNLIHRVWRAM